MKIIDLLNKIANGEEVPKKIKWGSFTLEWDDVGYNEWHLGMCLGLLYLLWRL